MFRSNSFVCAVLLVVQACGSKDSSDATLPEWGGAEPAAPAVPRAPEATPEKPAAPNVNSPANEGNVPIGSLSPRSEAPGNTDDGNIDDGNADSTEQPPASDGTPPIAPPVGNGVLAFPGAQGFGRFAVGARGRDVYHVTNLNDSGPGSLRDAVSVANRTVVFEVGGVIHLESRLIFKNNQTIAGQTAPGGGITLYGDGTSFSAASNTIVRYVRFRMGRTGTSASDAVTMANGHDVIWDHVSLSWGRDGTFDLNTSSGATLYNLTLQDSIVAQGLQTHSTGGLVATTGTSIIRSLYIDNNSRNPKARGTLQFVNNVIYNWVVSAYILGDTAGRSDGYMAGNYFISGPESNGGTLDSPTPQYNLFATDNFYDSDRNGTLNGRVLRQGDFGSVTWQTAPAVPFPEVPALPAGEALEYVATHAGTSIFRDAADDYVVSELRSYGTRGRTISDEVSLGLPNVVGNLPTAATPPDLDRDGMADAWERANGLDPNDVNDRNGDRNSDGWTNLEEYVNSLAP
jgi:pectate lyase